MRAIESHSIVDDALSRPISSVVGLCLPSILGAVLWLIALAVDQGLGGELGRAVLPLLLLGGFFGCIPLPVLLAIAVTIGARRRRSPGTNICWLLILAALVATIFDWGGCSWFMTLRSSGHRPTSTQSPAPRI